MTRVELADIKVGSFELRMTKLKNQSVNEPPGRIND